VLPATSSLPECWRRRGAKSFFFLERPRPGSKALLAADAGHVGCSPLPPRANFPKGFPEEARPLALFPGKTSLPASERSAFMSLHSFSPCAYLLHRSLTWFSDAASVPGAEIADTSPDDACRTLLSARTSFFSLHRPEEALSLPCPIFVTLLRLEGAFWRSKSTGPIPNCPRVVLKRRNGRGHWRLFRRETPPFRGSPPAWSRGPSRFSFPPFFRGLSISLRRFSSPEF